MADIFQPVKGIEEKIKQIPTIDGRVYFAYDTGNIYLDKDGHRYLMGGSSSGICYAYGTEENIVKSNPDDETDFHYTISFTALEDPQTVPLVDTLVLNSDGRFFRVISADKSNQTIDALLLAVSGTGGGGGGGGPAVVYSDRAKLNKKDPASNYLINGKSAIISVYGVSGKDIDGSFLDETLNFKWTLSEKDNSTGILTQYAQGGDTFLATTDNENPNWYNFDYGILARFSTTNVLTMWVTGTSSTDSRVLTYEFRTSELVLERHMNFNNINYYKPDEVNIYCNTKGDLEKIIYYYFEVNGEMVCLNPEGNILPSGNNSPNFKVPRELATHGPHKVRIELYQYINGKADLTSAATPIEMEIAVIDQNSTLPVIWLGEYQKEYYQYDSVKIPFRVYDPNATLVTTVTLFKDSTKMGTREITETSKFSIWEIVNADLNMQNYYSITCGVDENLVTREITFTLIEDPNRAGMKTETASLRYVFDASGRSNNESEANRVKCSYNNGVDTPIDAKLENFNWYNNGWMLDDDGNSCLRISNGAKLSIPLGVTTFATNSNSAQSHTFEFQFKIRNVQDYGQIIHNVTRYKGNSEAKHGTVYNWTDDEVYEVYNNRSYLDWSEGRIYDNYDAFLSWYLPAYIAHHPELQDPNQQVFPPTYDDLEYRSTVKILNTNYASGMYYDGVHGICIGAQDALFTNGTNTVNVSYVEDKIVNLTIVYSHGNGGNDGADKLMSIYLNGMLTGVTRSTADGAWSIGSTVTPPEIVFESNYCDFDLYKIRVYNQNLSLNSILINYMVDLKNPVGYDLSQLFEYNNSLKEYMFNYRAMLKYNEEHPDGYIMPYMIFTTKYKDGNILPFSKDVPISDVQIEFVNTGLDRAYTTGELGELAERAGQTIEDYYYHHCPSWKGDHIEMKVQGTSSEFYPRRNYKAKTKNYDPADETKTKKVQMYMNRGPFAQTYVENPDATHMDWFYYDNDTVGTTKFTLKIDYMESSGTYNMGFANLVNNAYTHHPYYDYIAKHAFQKESTDYSPIDMATAIYDDSKTYWYKNHKGNFKNTDEDELKIIHDEANPAAAFALGPKEYGTSKGVSKVNATDNSWYEAVTVYSDIELNDIKFSDLRTSVQGFPVLAFHQQTDANGNVIGEPKFIGRYNMLLDKGSDEAYGFRMDGVYQKFVTKKGKPVKISKVAECWEGENNSRGFCSFRDAATSRAEDDDKFFDTGKLTAYGAPVVADYWEYRYHDLADSLDVIYKLNENISDADSISTVLDECGIDISDPTPASSTDNKYTGQYTQGMKAAGDKLLSVYSNWEKAVQWVWSTNQDLVPSAGIYNPVDIGIAAYEPNKYYIARNIRGVITFVLDTSDSYDPQQTYYLDGEGQNTIKLCANDSLIYQAQTYYIDSGLGDYVLDPDSDFDAGIQYYALAMDEAHSGAKPLDAPVVYNNIEYNYDTKEYRNAKFVNDLAKHFNIEYLVTYFVMTEVFECYDSRGKNSMFASWGPQTEGGEYIWYPCFYDIDTQLGINNTGIPSFEYYVDATENGTFSTNDSVLWNNLYRNFKASIIQKYRQLRGFSSTYNALPHAPLKDIDRIEKWYLADPEVCGSMAMRGERPLLAFNLDEYYKYITITNHEAGYDNREGTTSYDSGTYFYALQGDRSLSRQQFLTNRMNYIDSWLTQGNYARGGNNLMAGRIAANSPSNTSDKWIEGTNVNAETFAPENINSPYWQDEAETIKTHMFDGEYWVTMEPARNQYVTVGTDTANFPSLKYTNLDGPVKFQTPDLENGVRTSGGYHEQLYYVYGTDQMKSFGDMSKLYWTEFRIEGKASKMTDLLLGYDGIDENGEHYKNSGINDFLIPAGADNKNGGMPLLKKVNMSYMIFSNNTPVYDFSSCQKLEDFRAIGSNIKNISFAPGCALKVLYLPSDLTVLSLTEATKLNNIVTEFRVRDDINKVDVKPGLYIPGLTEKEPVSNKYKSNIHTISLIGDWLGYDSYKLLSNYYEARKDEAVSSITITNVDWSPYKKLSIGYEYSEDEASRHLYWIDNGHYSFDEFTDYTEEKWNLGIKNNEIYRLDEALNAEAALISNTELLENLRDGNNFRNTMNESNPIISGIIYINNDTPIDEKEIENSFGTAYPDLKFFFKNVIKKPSAKYVILNDDGTYDELAKRSLGDNELFFPHPNSIINRSTLDDYDTRSQYDFYGWSTEPLSPAAVNALNNEEWFKASENHLIVTTTNENVLSSADQYDNWASQNRIDGKFDYVFYAVYYIHKYAMNYLDGDGSILATAYVPANASIVQYTPSPMYPIKEFSALEAGEKFDKVNKFIGWATSEKDQGEGKIKAWTDSEIGRASTNRTFYPVFTEVDVHDNVLTDMSLFAVNQVEINGVSYNNLTLIRPNDVRGKITLPSIVNGKVIQCFNDYGTASNTSSTITHIFWERGSQLQFIGANACSDWDNLMYFELPNYHMTLRMNSFFNDKKLFTGISQDNLNAWFSRVEVLGQSSLSGISSTYTRVTDPQALQGKTIILSNIQQIDNNALQAIVCDKIVFGSPTNTTLDYYSNFGSAICTNSCSKAGGTARTRVALDITYYDLVYLDRSTEDIKAELMDKLALNPSNGNVDVAHPPFDSL